MCSQDGRFASKEIETPQTVCRVTEDSEPGRPSRIRCRSVPHGENAPDHMLVDGEAEDQGDLLSDPWTPPVGFRCFMSTTAAMTAWLGPFGPGFVDTLDEKSR